MAMKRLTAGMTKGSGMKSGGKRTPNRKHKRVVNRGGGR